MASCHKYGVRPALYSAVANNAYMDVKNTKFNATGKARVQSADQYYELVTQQLTELWSNYCDLAECGSTAALTRSTSCHSPGSLAASNPTPWPSR